MALRHLQLHSEAVDEARAAAQWYGERNSSAADAFLHELDSAIEKIAEAPNTYPRHIAGTRRFFLRRFPFSVVYRETSGGIEVLAIAHVRRKPGYWRKRSA
jgi:plasmid stabilization system protein ParE